MNVNSAYEGFILDCEARRLSANTLNGYAFVLEKFREWIGGDTEVNTISTKDIKLFLNSFPLVKAKTVKNYHTCLSSLWTFMVNEGIVDDHIVHKVKAPKVDKKAIQPFSDMELKVLFASLERSQPYKRLNHTHEATHEVPNQKRMRAIMATLLETGIRVSEIINLRIQDVNMKEKNIHIISGKGRKDRIVHFEAKTAKVLWQYLKAERDRADPKEPLFISKEGTKLERRNLAGTLARIGKRAGVMPCNPHRFRHTCAIMYLRNGGDVITLQRLLGHESREMTDRYLALSQADFKNAHRIASPMENISLGF